MEIIEAVFFGKAVTFIVDFVFMLICALLFVCCLIGFNNGQIRAMFLLISGASLVLYLMTIHRPISRVHNKIASAVRRILKKISKKLKNSKKS